MMDRGMISMMMSDETLLDDLIEGCTIGWNNIEKTDNRSISMTTTPESKPMPTRFATGQIPTCQSEVKTPFPNDHNLRSHVDP